MTELLPGVETPSDAELISRVRGGDVAAYGELFTRHVEAARRLARQLMRGPDVDDLVSDAFAKTLGVIQAGGGPDVAFRAYLLTSVRRLHVDRIRAAKKVQPSEDMTLYDDGLPFQDPAVATFENGAAAKAFSSLPERWQLVLWHLEVEGQKPAEIAPLLGMTPNSVSALAYRAREGLRQAFLTMHLADCSTEQCRWVNQHLGAYVRKGLSRRDSGKVQEHLDECRRCTAMYLELTEVNSDLAAVIAPLVLGVAAAGYLSSVGGAGLTGVSAIIGRIRDAVGAQGTGGAGGAGASGTAASGAAAGGAAATGGAVAAGGVIAAGVAAVTTAAVLFGGSGPGQVTEAERPTPIVQSPAAGAPDERGPDAASQQQTRVAGQESATEDGLGKRSASEVVVVADRPRRGVDGPGDNSRSRGAGQPANPGTDKPVTPVGPTVDLPGPLPRIPVPPISAPEPPAPGTKPPADDTAPPPSGTGDPADKPAPAPAPAPAPDSGGEPPKDQDGQGKGDSKKDTSAGGETEHGKDGGTGSSSATISSIVEDGTAADDVTAGGSIEVERVEADPAATEAGPAAPAPEPTEDPTPASVPAEETTAATQLTIHDARMSRTTLEFELTGSGDLPDDVTVALADGTHGVAFVPEEQPERHLWEEGGTLRVTIRVVVFEPFTEARLRFTVDAGEPFEFVHPSGEPLTAPVEPTYELETTPAPADDSAPPYVDSAVIEVVQAEPVVVDQDGSGQVLVSVEGLDRDALVADTGRVELVLADDPSTTSPFVQVTGVVAGAEPGTLLVSFRIPPGHHDADTPWLVRIGEDGPATDPFLIVTAGHRGRGDAARDGAGERYTMDALPAGLVDAGFGEGI